MDSSNSDVIIIVKEALQGVSEEKTQKICDIFTESLVDGKSLAVANFSLLVQTFAEVPRGLLLRIFNKFSEKREREKIERALHMDTSVDSDSDTVPLTDSDITEDSSLTLNTSDEFSNSSSDEVPSSSHHIFTPNLCKPVPKVFPIELCRFGFYAKEVLRTGKITECGTSEITTELITVMKRYKRYPTAEIRRKVIQEFVKIGKATVGLDEDAAKKFWLRKVSSKINSQMKQMRKLSSPPKCFSKRKYNNISGTADTTCVKRRKSSVGLLETESNEEQFKEDKEILQDEFKKPSVCRNKRTICEKMEATFLYRCNYILNTKPSPNELMEQWPALFTYDELIRDFKRLQPTLPSETEIRNVGDVLFTKVIKFASEKPYKSANLKRILQMLPDEMDKFNDLSFAVGILLVCCLLTGNTKREFSQDRYLLDICPINTSFEDTKNAFGDRQQPILVIYGDAADPQKILLFAENQVILQTTNVVEGLLSLFACYFVFNYEYCPHVVKALYFLQTYLLKIGNNSPYHSVKELKLSLETSQ
uniref:Uncharacterized protein LOC104265813 n=1 Tax=Phallusia mammillata TaxID=59560 RepID=A0A6F9DI78_9ASCI|nr:uncharacterized protein LOC104265813 [Phallusia mammillata]